MTDRENSILWDEYFYPGSDVLINNYNIKDYDELKKEEATQSFDRLIELSQEPLNLDFGIVQLKEIHRYIFEDIYPFAGQYRKVNMLKDQANFFFMKNVEDLEDHLKELFEDISDMLKDCRSRYQFCDILAKLYTGLIFYHPFREGNGRTVREFIREFSIAKSKEVGLPELELDWKLINRDELNEYIEVAHLFPSATASLFDKALVEKDYSKN